MSKLGLPYVPCTLIWTNKNLDKYSSVYPTYLFKKFRHFWKLGDCHEKDLGIYLYATSSRSFTIAPIRAPLETVGSQGMTRWSTATVFILVVFITIVSCATLPGLDNGNPGCIDLRAKSPPTKHKPCGPKTNLPPLKMNLQQSDPLIIALVPVWHPFN